MSSKTSNLISVLPTVPPAGELVDIGRNVPLFLTQELEIEAVLRSYQIGSPPVNRKPGACLSNGIYLNAGEINTIFTRNATNDPNSDISHRGVVKFLSPYSLSTEIITVLK